MLSTLCLALCLGLPASPAGSTRTPEGGLVARIELQRGRALLVKDSGVVPVRRHLGVQISPGPGHLELAPASRAVVRWSGMGSLTLSGPSSVSWQELPSGGLLWRFGALHGAQVEIRGGQARIELPDAWRVDLGRGAFSFRGLPGGGTELKNQAGTLLRATWIGEEGISPPPIVIGPGQSALLAGAPRLEVAVDPTAATPPWTQTRWPWGRGGIPDVPDLTGDSGQPWPTGPWPWGPESEAMAPWERWDWPWSAAPPESEPQPVLEPAPVLEPTPEAGTRPARRPEDPERDLLPLVPPPASRGLRDEVAPTTPEPPSAVRNTSAAEAAEPRLESPPERIAEPNAEPPAELPPAGEVSLSTPSPLWRGLPEERLEVHRVFRLERSEDWIWEGLPSGRLRVELDPHAKRPRWYLGQELDLRLFPGAAIVLEEDGSLRFHEGWVRILGAVEGRDWSHQPPP